jgi:hypothetical protein
MFDIRERSDGDNFFKDKFWGKDAFEKVLD